MARRIIIIGILFILGFGMGTPTAQAEWSAQSCAMPHRIPVKLTVGAAGHTGDIRIDLSSADFASSYTFSTNGKDIRVYRSDDVTPINFAITKWDPAARTATIYIERGVLAPNSVHNIFIYYGNLSLSSNSAPNVVFPTAGIRLRSRVSPIDPVSATDARNAYRAATVDVYDGVRSTITGLNNRALGGINGDFGWCISAFLHVTTATAGTWEFQYGADFGYGGDLYVSDQLIEADWLNDLWWMGSYLNTADTLEGSITLAPGWHRYEAMGFEGCCDGLVGFQAKPPGGVWMDMNSTNFALRGSQCMNIEVTVTKSPVQSCSSTMLAEKSIAMDAATPNAYALPGAIVDYKIEVVNPGQSVTNNTVVLTDTFPPELGLIVTGTGVFTLTDGAVPSGLTLTYGGPASTTDDVEFSTNGTTFTYVPTSPVDTNVTHVRFRPKGILKPNVGGSKPSFSINLKGKIL